MKDVTDMTAGGIVLLVGFVVIACIFAVNYTTVGMRIWLRIRGATDEVMIHDASTPQGAAAYYNSAIEEKDKAYTNAVQTLSKMTGKVQTYEQQLRDYKKQKMQYDMDIKTCIESGDDDTARILLKKQADLDDKIEILKTSVAELKNSVQIQQENVDTLKEEKEALKAEKDKSILELETSQAIQALKVDDISTTEEDKMLEKVRDGVQKAKEAATGHKIAYENSDAVQQKRIDQRMRDADVEAKLQELKKATKK
jgi:phage shock protein A